MKKCLSMVLALLMLLSLLAACSSEPATTTDNTPAVDSTVTEEPTTEPEAPAEEPTEEPEAPAEEPAEEPTEEPVEEPVEAPAALPEATGVVELPITDDVTSYSIWAGNFMDSAIPYTDPNEFPIWQELEARTNIHFDWTLSSSAAEQFSLMIASEDYDDIFAGVMNLLTGGVDYSIEEEIIIDLAELVPQYAPNYYALMTADEYTRKNCYTDTSKLGALRIVQSSVEPTWMGFYVRQDWLNDVGYEGTLETYDDWTNVLGLWKDAGLGKLYLGNVTGLNDMLMGGFGVNADFLQKNGEVFYGPVDQGFHDYLAQISAWYKAGYIDSDFVSQGSFLTDYNQLIDGTVGLMQNLYTLYDLISMMGMGSDPDYQLTAVDFPKVNADDALKIQIFPIATVRLGGSSTNISTACEDPIPFLQWVDYLCTEDGYMLANYGIEGESYNLVDGKPVYTELVTANPDGLTSGQVQGLYSVTSFVTQWYDFARAGSTASEGAMSGQAIWGADFDYEDFWSMPESGALTFTAEESEDLGSSVSDISTYVAEYAALVITGAQDLDSTWDEYVANIESMGLQDCIDVYEAAYARFQAR